MPSPGDDDSEDADRSRSPPDEETASDSPGETPEEEATHRREDSPDGTADPERQSAEPAHRGVGPENQDRRGNSADNIPGWEPSESDDTTRGQSGHEEQPVGQGPAERPGRDGREQAYSRRPEALGPEEWRREPGQRRPSPEESDAHSRSEWSLFAYDVVSSVLAVAVIGAYLFAVSGVWPPLVAVESGSMEPNMQVNDLVFVMEEERFPGSGAHPTGVVTARAGEGVDYRQFNGYGDVIVYQPDGNQQTTPIIHRAMFWVEAGDNWCRQADPSHLGGLDPNSDRCIADHSGFITKGDNNARYDQAQRLSGPVKPEWVVGTAQVRVPGLGWIRLHTAG